MFCWTSATMCLTQNPQAQVAAGPRAQVVEQLRLEHTEGKVNKEDFARVVRRTLGHAPGTSTASTLSSEKLDVLYRALDTDKDGLLSVSELERHHDALLQK